MDDNLGVALGPEAVAACDELVPQLDVVENLAIEYDPQRAILVGQRLLSGGEIDDRESRMSEADVRIAVDAKLIRTTVLECAEHPLQRSSRRCGLGAQIHDAADAAHVI
jgi:hypothetical protein